jgi:hypothetical protein
MQPTVLIAFFSLAGGPAAYQYHPDRIDALIELLDAYQFPARERAAKELVGIGVPAIGALKKALAKSPSPETAGRAERLIREIRYRYTKGGSVVAGFRATLRLVEDTYREGNDISFSLDIENVSHTPRTIAPPVWWSFSVGAGAVIDEFERFGRPLDGEIVIHDLSGKMRKQDGFLFSGDRRDRVTMTLRGGQALADTVALGEYGRNLPPGDYDVELVIHLFPMQPDSTQPLTTNKVRITVVERSR